jgi:hypothetical protein
MFKFASDFWTSKTTWTGAAAIAVAAYQFFHKQIDANTAWMTISAALGLIFHRDAAAKHAENERADRQQLIKAAQAQAPAVPITAIEGVMAAHLNLHTDGIRAAVATAVGTILQGLLTGAQQVSNVEVAEAAVAASNAAVSKPVLRVEEGGQGQNEPDDGEVDRE